MMSKTVNSSALSTLLPRVRRGAGLACGLLLALSLAAPAWADRALTKRYGINAAGDIALLGNVVLTCTASAACTTTLNGGNGANDRNDSHTMVHLDTDSDSATFNSTSAQLSMPAGSTVRFAGLYWSGNTTNIARSQVLLRTPTSFGYRNIYADVLDTTAYSGSTNYQGMADITAIVAAAGSGAYTVANVQATANASAQYGAWAIIVVYANNSLPLRNLTVFDGLQHLNTQTVNLPVSGFLTPLSGPVSTRLGVLAYEGDKPAAQDNLRLNGTEVLDANNQSNNFFNASISNLGSPVSTGNPAYLNNMQLDLDRVSVPAGIIGNGQTSATIGVTSTASTEQFMLGAVTFATDLYVPIVTPNIVKTAIDLNGGALVAGDTLRWKIYLKNTGQDTATKLTLSDPIPAQVDYKPGSLSILSGANAGAKTDAAGDDHAEYIAAGQPRIVFRLGDTATATQGGNLPYGYDSEIQFDTIVKPGLAAGTTINNVVTVGYAGQTIGETFSGTAAAATAVVMAAPQLAKSFSPSAIDIGGVAVLNITLRNPAGNPANADGVSFTDNYPAGLVNAASPNLQVSCTPGSTPGTLSGGLAGGSNVALSGAVLAPNGQCTVSVNVTASAVGNYANLISSASSTNAGSSGSGGATLAVGKPLISKAFSPATITAGNTSTLSFTLTNRAALALSGLAFSDSLSNMVVAPTPAVSNTCGGTVSAAAGAASISLSGGTLAANGSCTLSVNVRSTVGGEHPNTATGVSSTQTGSAGSPSNTAWLKVLLPPVVSKLFYPPSVRANQPSELRLTVSNPNADSLLSNVSLTDNYPAGLINDNPANAALDCTPGSSATRTGGANGGSSLGLSGGSLLPGGSCTLTVSTESATAGNYLNTTGAVGSQVGSGNSASATLNVTSMTAPTLAKSFSPTAVARNTSSTLTLTLSNSNATAITGVALSDNYPNGLVNADPLVLSNSCGGTVSAVAGEGSLSLSGAGIPANGSCAVSVAVQAADGGRYINTINRVITGNAGTFGPATATLDVLRPPLLSKSFAPSSIASGGTSTLTLTLSNPTTAATALSGVALDDVFPSGMRVHTTPGLSNSCGGTLRDQGNSTTIGGGDTALYLSGVTLAANATCTVVVTVSTTGVGSFNNQTSAVRSSNGGDGASAAATLAVGQPSLSKAFAPATVIVGQTSVLTITLTNPTGVAITGVALTDSYPQGMVNAATPAVATSCNSGGATPTLTAVAGAGSVAITGGRIAANGSCTVTVTVSASQSGSNTLAAGALSSSGGTNANPATALLTVRALPEVVKAFSPEVVLPNGVSRLSITLTNSNDVAATGVSFTDNYPSGLLNAAAPSLSNGCGGTATAVANGTALSLSGATIPANSACVVSVNVLSATPGSYVNNTGSVATGNVGTAAGHSATLVVMAPPTLAKTFTPSMVLINEPSLLTLTLGNSNPVAVSDISLTDSYPAGLLNTATPGFSSSCAGATLSGTAGGNSLGLTGASLAANSSCSLSAQVVATMAGAYVNTTGTVSTGNAGTGATATATLTVGLPQPVLELTKAVLVISDPLNLASHPKSIPGAVSIYTIRLSNSGPGQTDANSLVISDALPAHAELYVGDLGAPGSGPVQITDGNPVSGLAWSFSGLANTGDSLEFSNDGGATWTYVPTPNAEGFDGSVSNLRIKPTGQMKAATGSNPFLELQFRVRVR